MRCTRRLLVLVFVLLVVGTAIAAPTPYDEPTSHPWNKVPYGATQTRFDIPSGVITIFGDNVWSYKWAETDLNSGHLITSNVFNWMTTKGEGRLSRSNTLHLFSAKSELSQTDTFSQAKVEREASFSAQKNIADTCGTALYAQYGHGRDTWLQMNTELSGVRATMVPTNHWTGDGGHRRLTIAIAGNSNAAA